MDARVSRGCRKGARERVEEGQVDRLWRSRGWGGLQLLDRGQSAVDRLHSQLHCTWAAKSETIRVPKRISNPCLAMKLSAPSN